MKKVVLVSLLAVFAIAVAFKSIGGGESYETLKIGSKAPMLKHEMKSSNGESFSLEGIKDANGTLVIFSCNTCPFVIAWEDRYPGLVKMAKEANIGFTLINSNEAKRKGDDSVSEMKEHAENNGYGDVAYLVDANSELANAFGAKTTPHVFLFDKNWKLVYEGAIDDNHKSADAAQKHYLKDAIKNLKAGKKIDPNDTKAIGCSIKRVKS